MGVEDIVIGMAHRGRLAMLGLLMDKPLHNIFYDFNPGGSLEEDHLGSGDVKYHCTKPN